MNPLVLLLTSSLEAKAVQLLVEELQAGSHLNQAVETVLAKLEDHIPDENARKSADKVLRSLIDVVEEFALHVLSVQSPAKQPA